jgi:hypothetical protein
MIFTTMGAIGEIEAIAYLWQVGGLSKFHIFKLQQMQVNDYKLET